jgi:hypothetical protein
VLPPHAIPIVMQMARTKRIYGTTDDAANNSAES